MRIGLLADHPAIIDYMNVALTLRGHSVTTHTESESLFEALFDQGSVRYPIPYDLLIVDLYLPKKLSATHCIKYIQHLIAAERLPIIALSTVALNELGAPSTELTATTLLRKPFSMKLLLQIIERCTQQKTEMASYSSTAQTQVAEVS